MSNNWWEEDAEANRQGFGVILHLEQDQWIVHRALLGSPAESAGILKGDIMHAIGGTTLPKALRPTKLAASIELLDPNAEHQIDLLRGQTKITAKMRPKVLLELFAEDAARGGATLGYCYSCPTCYSRTSGVKQCSDCPGYNCTTG